MAHGDETADAQPFVDLIEIELPDGSDTVAALQALAERRGDLGVGHDRPEWRFIDHSQAAMIVGRVLAAR